MSENKNTIPAEGDIKIDIMTTLKNIWAIRKKLLKIGVITFVIACVIVLLIPKKYGIMVTLAPEAGQNGEGVLSGVASMLGMGGLNMGEDADALNVDLYPDIVSSTPFMLDILDTKVKRLNNLDEEMTIEEYIENIEKVVKFIKDHPMGCPIALLIVLLLVVIISVASTVMLFFSGTVNSMVASSYTAQDNDILTVEANYVALEEALQEQIDAIESDYPDYDEYRYNLAEIGHDEYELASYLTVLFEDYTPSEVSSTLQNIFDAQYELTITPITEIRTRTEIRYRDETRYREEGGVLVPYTVTVAYEVEVEYEYHILQITLTNSGIGAVVAGAGLTEDQMERYQILLSTKGNKAYLFEDSIYANPSDDYLDYDVPGEYFTDNEFGNMIHEAEKYLGYPYVWGGSSPSTSFDCSGFVSYVINNCGNGWNVGRQTANGLKNCCSIIRPEEAKPGDLVFFQGTYNTSGASHVGIYVGDGMMIHCGNPISYASIETSYWEEHFYCFGRLP